MKCIIFRLYIFVPIIKYSKAKLFYEGESINKLTDFKRELNLKITYVYHRKQGVKSLYPC